MGAEAIGCRVFHEFLVYFCAQLSDALDADGFLVLFLAIDCQEKIGDQTGKNLYHQAMLASGD